jgi:hypothetical protein
MKYIKLFEEFNDDEPSDYKMSHSAPVNDGFCKPMNDVSIMFPDMYTPNALKYYGGYDLDDAQVINQIKSVYGKPNANVVIYRAVPDINKSIDTEIKKLAEILNYKRKFSFFPMNNKIITDLEKEVWEETPSLTYDAMQNVVADRIQNTIDVLLAKKTKPIKINNGDWVTTSKLYAKQHGDSYLDDYKIITKTVKASQLYTDGNSIFEWGYSI